MDLDKAWLYRQGNWTEVDDPSAQFQEELDNLFKSCTTPGAENLRCIR